MDLETGEVFAFITQMWRRTGLYCARQPHNIEDLKRKIEKYSRAMKMELENEDQTSLIRPHNEDRTYTPTPLPLMDDPEVYITHSNVMHITTRRNYVRDRMRAAITYINEYQETYTQLAEDNTHLDAMLTRLRIIYGHVDAIRSRIDNALLTDDMFRRRRNMRDMPLPTRFPSPQMMGQASITAWTSWIRTETNQVMMTVKEEVQRAGDPDDPFDGTAGGIFAPPPAHQTTVLRPVQQLMLPPPTHTPEQQKNKQPQKAQKTVGVTEGIEHSIQSPQPYPRDEGAATSREQAGLAQAPSNEGIKHSIHSHNPNDTIKELHTQQRRQRQEYPTQQGTPTSQENLITFTPTPTRGNPGVGTPTGTDVRPETEQGSVQQIPQQNPMPQRAPRQKEQNETINQVQPEDSHIPHLEEEAQREVNQTINQTQPEVSHISHMEEEVQREVRQDQGEQNRDQDTSYIQIPHTLEYTKGKLRLCWRCGEAGHSKRACKNYVYCEICQNYSHATQACFRYENFVRNNPVASSRVTSPVNNYKRNIQGRPIQKPQQTSGRQNMAHFPRFQPPVVPGKLPKTNYPMQGEVRSKQDVRSDPQFNGVTTHHGQIKQKVGTKTQQYVKQPIDINEVRLEDNLRWQQEQQHWEEQISQLQREESLRKEKKGNSARIIQGVLKPKKENSMYEDRMAESKIAQIIKETDRPVFVNHYYAAAAEPLSQATRPTKTVYIVDGIEHSIHSAKVTQTTEKSTRDAAAQVTQSECFEHSIHLTQTLETAQHRLRETEKIQIQGQNYGAYQTMQTYPVTQGPVVVEPTGPNTSNVSVSSLPVLSNFSVPPPISQTTTPTVPVVQPSAPPMPSQVMAPNTPSTTEKSSREIEILESIRDITKVLGSHIKLSTRNAEENTIQNAMLLQQFIKSQDKRALDPALMAIPTFSGKDRTKCLDWLSRVRNVCKQSG